METFEPIKGDAEELKDVRQVVEAMFGKKSVFCRVVVCCCVVQGC